MKIRIIILSAIVLTCFVADGNCGVINDVYGNVRDKTTAVKDGVVSWLSSGKEWVLGSNEHPSQKGRNADEIIADDGVFNKIFNKLLSGFQSIRDKVYGFFISDDKENNTFITGLYDKVKHRMTVITAFALGDDKKGEPKATDDLSEIRRAVNTMINHQKHRFEEKIHEGGETLKDKIENVKETLHDSIEVLKDDVSDIKKRAGEGIENASDLINKEVIDAKEKFSSTLHEWQQSGVEISEKEREVLNAISNRLRNRIRNVQYAIENPEQLTKAEN